MPLSSTSVAPAVGASVTNVQFAAAAEVLPRKNLIIGTYDPAITTLTNNVPMFVTSAEEVGSIAGRGFMAHRLAVQNFLGSGGGETWFIPQAEAGGAAQATGSITISSAATASGTLSLYIAGISVPVPVTSGDSETVIAAAIVTAITANADLPVTATSAVGVVTVTAKSAGPWGDDISFTFNWGFQEAFPADVAVIVVNMSGGTGIPTIADALNNLGTGDAANEQHFTDMVHGYGQDSTTLDAVLTYVGAGNTAVGLWSKTVARPFRSLIGDTTAGSGGLSSLISLADGRKTDRATGIIAAPGSPNHPAEIAALAAGIASKLNNNRAQEHALGQILPGIIPGSKTGDRWTDSYDNKDTANKNGIGTTAASGGALVIQLMLTFYRPDTVPSTTNSYRSYRNISILQNQLDSVKTNFEQDKWLGVSLVESVANVSNIIDRQKARDVEAVKDDLVALVQSWLKKSWIFEAETFAIPNIQVQIRAGTNGFDAIVPVILSGEIGILDTNIEHDVSIAVLL
jgi:phage tail sheath gpL-like